MTDAAMKRTALQWPWSLGRDDAQSGMRSHGCIVDGGGLPGTQCPLRYAT